MDDIMAAYSANDKTQANKKNSNKAAPRRKPDSEDASKNVSPEGEAMQNLQAMADKKNGEPSAQNDLQAAANNFDASKSPAQLKANGTGLPDSLKSGMENLSGASLDDVQVHANSSAPAQVGAQAYSQGSEVHIASGQEQHQAHEAAHVVQQQQGAVKPTAQLKSKGNINDAPALENEANAIGARALNRANNNGVAMDDVNVNANGAAQANAQAYAQGNNVNIAPGQEQHLGHEAAHVVQQRQGAANQIVQRKANTSGLPSNLKSGMENFTGAAMDDVKVNANSNAPAQINAHAYAQGNNINVASGQEKHIPHEATHVAQQKQGAVKPTVQLKANSSGLPSNLKSGMENLTGAAMDDVKVNANSSAPAQVNAHAYAQGNNINVASGQEKHVPHEATHVVQQKQGAVKPTAQLKSKSNNNGAGVLENEADAMAANAMNPANLNGVAMDDVNVNANGPAQVNAQAYAQGNDVHIAPGQEQHLPHEAAHVVQQRQGAVKPAAQLKKKAVTTKPQR